MSSVMTAATPSPRLFLLNSLKVGGSEKKIVAVANALHRIGRPVHLAYLNAPHTLCDTLDRDLPQLCLGRRGKLDRQALRALATYIARHGIEAIHCISRYPMIYGYLTAPRRPDPRFHVYLNSIKLPNRAEVAKMALYAPILGRARRIVFGCRYQQDLWIRRYRLPAARCGVVYNGVDTGHYDPARLAAPQRGLRAGLGFAPADVVVGMVGALSPRKGYPDFLAALAALRAEGHPVKGLIVGDGPERGRLARLAASHGLDVRFLGEIADVRAPLYAMDVFVLSSLSETFSNAALEAMAMGRPVVLSALGGAAEMVEDGVSGCIFPPGRVDALTARLRPLVTDAVYRAELARAGQRRVVERFGFDHMVQAYDALLWSDGAAVRLPRKSA